MYVCLLTRYYSEKLYSCRQRLTAVTSYYVLFREDFGYFLKFEFLKNHSV